MTNLWQIEFFPSEDDRDSPFNYIAGLSNESDQDAIMHRLKDILGKRPKSDWPHTFVHKIEGDIYQLTAGQHRLLFVLDDKKILILHACRKQKKKLLKKDKKRAILNYHKYLDQKGR